MEAIAMSETEIFNPMNDVAFKFIFGKEERKQITSISSTPYCINLLRMKSETLAFVRQR